VHNSGIIDKESSLPIETQRGILVIQLATHWAALPLESVERITPMAQVARPPGLPAPLEGVLNLAGAAVPVLRLDRLFGLPAQTLGLYSSLVVMKGGAGERVAILADRASEVISIPESTLLPIGDQLVFNGCADATFRRGDAVVHLLSPARLLLEAERRSLAEFQSMAQQRLEGWPERP
jgi:purine-binding chemotaxis protein CheW